MISFGIFVFASKDNILTPEIAFVSLSLFNGLKHPMATLPISVSNIIQASVALKRIRNFLLKEEINDDDITHIPNESNVLVLRIYFEFTEPKNEKCTF